MPLHIPTTTPTMGGVVGVSRMYDKSARLKNLLKEFRERKGVVRLVIREQIHILVHNMPLVEALGVISTINDEEELNTLLGVGVRGALYHAIVKRKAVMMGL